MEDFSEQLNHCVQALQTMKKLSQVDGNVSMTLDKLPGIRGDFVRTDPNWEKWTFAELSEAIRQWTRRNPVDQNRTDRDKDRYASARVFHAKSRECVYCGDVTHKAGSCTKITNVCERKQTLSKKRLCFNCAIEAIVQPSVRARVRVRNVENDITPPSAKRHQPTVKKRP